MNTVHPVWCIPARCRTVHPGTVTPPGTYHLGSGALYFDTDRGRIWACIRRADINGQVGNTAITVSLTPLACTRADIQWIDTTPEELRAVADFLIDIAYLAVPQ